MATKREKSPYKELATGYRVLGDLRAVIEQVIEDDVPVKITLPRTWCREATNVPLLSPKALRLIDLHDAPDSHFKRSGVFVLEVGRKRFAWSKDA